MRNELIFVYVDSKFDVPGFKFTMKEGSSTCWMSFSLFLWWSQK